MLFLLTYVKIGNMQALLCPHCKKEVEITQALHDQVFAQVSQQEHERYLKEVEKVRIEEKEKTERRMKEEIAIKLKDLENEKKSANDRIEKLVQQILQTNEENRTLKQKDEEREIENQKKLNQLEEKIKAETMKKVSEEKQFEILQMKKQLEDTQKALEDAKRKSQQVSQQLQGEVLELELEEMLRTAFPLDTIEAVGKGISGADIRHIVKSPLGNICGVILWEFKRTKHWDDKWIGKLKDDVRAENANIPVIVSQILPKEAENGLGLKDKVWICGFPLVLPLAELLRNNLYDVARQKAMQSNSTEKAQLVYTYLTSHEFQQQVEAMVETYQAMKDQLDREKIVFQKQWKMREEQISRVLLSTATIIGSVQGKIGTSMPQIKGLDLFDLEDGKENKLPL